VAIRSPYPDVEIPAVGVYDYIFGGLTPDDAKRTAITDGATGTALTYGELVARIDAVAGALAARGFGPGDVVALYGVNEPAFAVVFHAILRAGATVTTVNAISSAEEVTRQLADSGAKAIFASAILAPNAATAAASHGIPGDLAFNLAELDALVAEGHPAPDVTFDPVTQIAALPYSSGTTGEPKGVKLTHTNLVANMAQMVPVQHVDPADVVLAVLPFTHIYGMNVLLNLTLRQRASAITLPRFDLVQFLGTIQDRKVTYVYIAPPIAVALAKHPVVDSYDLSSIRVMVSGAAALDEALGQAVMKRLGITMVQGYGMTEMSPVSHVMPVERKDISIGSIGLILPNIEARVVDTLTGEEIGLPESGVSAPGELLCRGPNVMSGYLGNDEATADTLEPDGFLHTGDIVTVDSKGVFYVVDRLKELIKYKGYQVPPAELEALLLTHPAIADAAVVALPDEEAGEVPKAFVVKQPGAELTGDEVKAFVARHVAPYKKVRAVEFIDAIPKATSGKILRKDLRARDSR
jgi:4-coumarate--CoA ligase